MARFAPLTTMSVGVGLATGLYGISFGALSTAAGLDIWQTQVLSLLMFSGGSQFAFIGVVAAGGPAAAGAAIISAWLLGVRNGFYAVKMNSVLQVVGLKRFVAAQLTIDESTGVATSQESLADQRKGFWITGVSVFIFWNLLTLIGALLGNALGDPKAWGLDAAAAAAFLGLLWPRLKQRQALAVAALAFLVAVVTTPSLPAGVPVILAGVVAVVVGLLNLFEQKVKGE
ncbi:MAG: AzlC family ABC transporter permease [Rhodoluna sp.]|jgi:predicted branched-subunit amino acid permease|nr:AzlC family ABC transporter permease [Rhodoluna sp.]MBP7819106.1 AzlC family ABC transporter permease [Rhodoluna sp.]